jgi:hypothetical protein
MKSKVKAVGLYEALYSMGGRGYRANAGDINVARIHEGIFRIMGSMLFNPQKLDITERINN